MFLRTPASPDESSPSASEEVSLTVYLTLRASTIAFSAVNFRSVVESS